MLTVYDIFDGIVKSGIEIQRTIYFDSIISSVETREGVSVHDQFVMLIVQGRGMGLDVVQGDDNCTLSMLTECARKLGELGFNNVQSQVIMSSMYPRVQLSVIKKQVEKSDGWIDRFIAFFRRPAKAT